MRYFLYILIAWFSIAASVAEASEVLLGVVVTVNRDRGNITLKLIDTSGSGKDLSSPESLLITVDPDKIPNNLASGDAVQVWGEYAGGGGMSSFRASSIRKRGSGSSGSDPTGVRSRLGQSGSGQGGNRRQSGRQ